MPISELLQAGEAFITSSGGGVMAVTRVSGAAIGDGRPGRITRELNATPWEWLKLPQYSTRIAY